MISAYARLYKVRHGQKMSKMFDIGTDILFSQAVPRPLGKRDEIAPHFGRDVAEPPLREEFLRTWEDFGIAMTKVCGHANRDTGRDGPILELEGMLRKYACTSVHGAVAQTMNFS